MKIQRKLELFLWCGCLFNSPVLFAHGYQTAPYSRTAYVVDSGESEKVNYNPNQISNNLPDNLGKKTLDEIMNYVSETNGNGPLAFYKDYYNVHGKKLCAFSANNKGFLSILNKPLPDNKMTVVGVGEPVQFKWGYSAWHEPSNNFVFMTEYPAGQYKPNPSLKDLHFVCAVHADSTGAWQCPLPTFNGDAKQVMVTIWQRVDAAGENFISCADVVVKGGSVVPPETIWSILGPQVSWISTLNEEPKEGDLVHFDLNGEKIANAQKSLIASYSVSVTAANLSKWDSILADKINNDPTHSGIIAVGQLKTNQGDVVYNKTDRNNNYVYLNQTVSNPKLTYSYTITKEKDPNPVIVGWQQVGEPLKVWVNEHNVHEKDQLKFSLQVAGIEQTLPPVTVDNPANAEQQVADAVTKGHFNDLKVAAGVLGQDGNVQFVLGGNNLVYVYRPSDDTTAISYVVRNISQTPKYPVYPEGIGHYNAGDLVQNENGQVYMCLEAAWCNLSAYQLTTEGAWKAVNPKPAPQGYLTYPEGQPYANGNIAADIEGNLYKCIQPNWCNNQSGIYTPGIGRAWSSAWEKQ